MLYAALGAALWELPVAVVAPLGDDYPARALHALEHRGVDLAGLRPLGRPGLRTWLLYEPAARRIVHRLGAANHVEASPAPGDVAGRFAGSARLPPLAHAARVPAPPARGARGPRRARCSRSTRTTPVREESLEAWREVAGEARTSFFVSEEELQLPGLRDDPAGHAGAPGGRAAAPRAAQARRGRRRALRHAHARADRAGAPRVTRAGGSDRRGRRLRRRLPRGAAGRRERRPARSSAAWSRPRSRSRPGERRD